MPKRAPWVVGLVLLAASIHCGTDGSGDLGRDAPRAAPAAASAAPSPQELSAALNVLSQQAVFFDHASVGMKVDSGVDRILSSASGPHPTRLDWGQTYGVGSGQVAAVSAGRWADHYFVAENGYPVQKIEEFRSADLGGGLGARLDALGGVAMMKLCFADFDSPGLTSTSAVDSAFATYRSTVSAIQSAYPNLKVVHVTAALRSGGNGLRERFNQQLRDTYGSTGRVFDLADAESNGRVDGSGVRIMDPAYNDGSDHPNVAGQDALASAMLVFTAGVFQPANTSLTSVALFPATVEGGGASTGTVTLSGAAPAGGVSVALSSGSPVAAVPVSVTVAAGAASANFTVSTSTVAAITTATIAATYAGTSRTATLAVTPPQPPPTLASVVFSPTAVVGGTSSTGTVTLSGAAPPGGVPVALSSDSPVAAVPASVTVAAGATGATFTATAAAVTATTTATIAATYAGTSRAAALTVTPAPPVGSLAQDAGFPTRNVYGWTTGAKSFSFTTPGANRLVVVAVAYRNYLQAATGHTVSGGGLAWTLARQTLADGSATFVSLWSAWVPAAGTYTATFNSGLTRSYDAFLTVHSFSGSSASGLGGVAGASGGSSLPSLGPIATAGTSSYLLAVGTYDSSTSPTADAASTRTAVDVSAGPAFWTQRSTATLPPGTHSIGLSAPTAPRSWAMAAAEVRAGP